MHAAFAASIALAVSLALTTDCSTKKTVSVARCSGRRHQVVPRLGLLLVVCVSVRNSPDGAVTGRFAILK